jgi:cystathionine gamma-synthase
MQTTSTSWRAEDLGQPIPADPHAVSVCLPRWQDNVGYEENDPAVIDAMQCGYPRFFIHPKVAELFEECHAFVDRGVETQTLQDDEYAFVFPSSRVAQRCVAFLKRQGIAGRREPCFNSKLHAVFLPRKDRAQAKAYWQHSGDIVSSRQATRFLDETSPADATVAKKEIRRRVAQLHDCAEEDVWLFPSGMAAIFCAYRLFQRMRPLNRSVQFGFPYVDILKIQEQFSHADAPPVAFFPRGSEAELDDVANLAGQETLQGLFVEIPGNPLLTSPNINRLSQLAKAHDFPLMVDDTLAACSNLKTLHLADIVCTSLTKYFSGAGNVIAGALVLNKDSRLSDQLRELLATEYEDLLYADDALVLEENSRDFLERIPRINDNAQKLAEYLQAAPEVEQVYYPSLADNANYTNLMRPAAGFGGLLSFVLHNSADTTPDFLDALQIPKGPNLGTSFTLVCPYTILAHYNELDFVEGLGVSRFLIRVSVGLEDPDWIIEKFRQAIGQSENIA